MHRPGPRLTRPGRAIAGPLLALLQGGPATSESVRWRPLHPVDQPEVCISWGVGDATSLDVGGLRESQALPAPITTVAVTMAETTATAASRKPRAISS